jgi:hypothetical protein
MDAKPITAAESRKGLFPAGQEGQQDREAIEPN